HTFHLHGHRWVLRGPHGTDLGTTQLSKQDTPVSQLEDTRLTGPANSWGFTVQQGDFSFLGPPPFHRPGEWPLHCHVSSHMMDMMCSVLIVEGGELAVDLPSGRMEHHSPPASPEDQSASPGPGSPASPAGAPPASGHTESHSAREDYRGS